MEDNRKKVEKSSLKNKSVSSNNMKILPQVIKNQHVQMKDNLQTKTRKVVIKKQKCVIKKYEDTPLPQPISIFGIKQIEKVGINCNTDGEIVLCRQ